MAKNQIKLDTSGLEKYIQHIEAAGGDAKKVTDAALKKAAEKIKADTQAATAKSNLPAQGHYSYGDTMDSIVQDTSPQWEGDVGWVPVGFDFSKPGAGGWLISGTPKMRPAARLHEMFKTKKYMANIQNEIADELLNEVIDAARKG